MGVDVQHETQNFVKNLGIFAGLLLLAAINMEQPSEDIMNDDTPHSDT